MKLIGKTALAGMVLMLVLFTSSVFSANEEELYSDHKADAERVMPGDQAQHGSFSFLTSAKGVYQSQILLQSDGSLLLVWVQKGLYDLDLFVARQQQDGEFSRPLRINQRGLNRYTGDEARPSVALGPDGAVAIAWTAASHDIMIAVGSNFGTEFDAPLKLNQDEQHSHRAVCAASLEPATHLESSSVHLPSIHIAGRCHRASPRGPERHRLQPGTCR